MIELKVVGKLLNKLRKAENIRDYKDKVSVKWQKKYGLKGPQVNFLACIVAGERIKRIGGAV